MLSLRLNGGEKKCRMAVKTTSIVGVGADTPRGEFPTPPARNTIVIGVYAERRKLSAVGSTSQSRDL